MEGKLAQEEGEVSLDFEIDLKNKTISYTDPRTNKWEMRAIPQMQIRTDSSLSLNGDRK